MSEFKVGDIVVAKPCCDNITKGKEYNVKGLYCNLLLIECDKGFDDYYNSDYFKLKEPEFKVGDRVVRNEPDCHLGTGTVLAVWGEGNCVIRFDNYDYISETDYHIFNSKELVIKKQLVRWFNVYPDKVSRPYDSKEVADLVSVDSRLYCKKVIFDL